MYIGEQMEVIHATVSCPDTDIVRLLFCSYSRYIIAHSEWCFLADTHIVRYGCRIVYICSNIIIIIIIVSKI